MECEICKYLRKADDFVWGAPSNIWGACNITNRCNPTSCNLSYAEIENMEICFNCEYWLGGGDWGLSCSKNYYDCNSNGFRKACEQFKRKGLKNESCS